MDSPIPAKIIDTDGYFAKVKALGIETRVNIQLIYEPKIGDNVLIYNGFAVEKIDEGYFNLLSEQLNNSLNQYYYYYK